MWNRFFTRNFAIKVGFTASSLLAFSLLSKIYGLNNYHNSLGIDIESITGALFYSGLAVLIIALFVYTGAYLEIFGVDREKEVSDLKLDYQSFRSDLNALKNKVEAIPPQKGEDQMQKYVLDLFDTQIKNDIEKKLGDNVGEIAKDSLLRDYAPNIYREKSFEIIQKLYENSIRGMQERIEKQETASRISLLYGVGFALSGLFALGVFVFQPFFNLPYKSLVENAGADWNQFLISFLPRFSFVIIFESIAFFFLKTYRDDKAMIRYFRNEITNAEEKSFGMMSAILFAKEKSIDSSILELMRTERNFTLKKGERTISEITNHNDELFVESIVNRVLSVGRAKIVSDSKGSTSDSK